MVNGGGEEDLGKGGNHGLEGGTLGRHSVSIIASRHKDFAFSWKKQSMPQLLI
jgi:hypothetical protein